MFFRMLKILMIFCMLFIFDSQVMASAQHPINKIVIFGDSLSDIGNTQFLLQTLNNQPDKGAEYLVYPAMRDIERDIDKTNLPNFIKRWMKQHADIVALDVATKMQSVIAKGGFPVLPSNPPYYTGHFSNSCVWDEYLADALQLQRKLTINTASKEDTRYFDNRAFGGSWTVVRDHEFWQEIEDAFLHHDVLERIKDAFIDLIEGKYVPPGLDFIVDAYLNEHPSSIDQNTLFFIFDGGNDYLNYINFPHADDAQVMQHYTTNVVNAMIENMNKLLDHGAKNIMLFNMPDLAKTPRFIKSEQADVVNRVIQMHNKLLLQAVETAQRQHPDINIMLFDLYDQLNDILAHADNYGYKITDQACVVSGLMLRQSPAVNRFQNNPELDVAATLGAPVGLSAVQSLEVAQSSIDQAQAMHNITCDNPAVTITNNPDDYVFFDSVHPTTKSHRLIAERVLQLLQKNNYSVNKIVEPTTQCKATLKVGFNRP